MTPATDPAARIAQILATFLPGQEIGSLVDGQVMTGTGADLDLTDPATGQVFARFRDADNSVVDAAMDAAAQAQKLWASMTASARGRVMVEIARKIREHAPEIAELESRSAGRPIRDIRGEAVRIAEMFEYYAGWCDKLHGEVIPVPSGHLNYTRHEPIGVVVQITP